MKKGTAAVFDNQPFEEKYMSVLQNIEAAIVSVYNNHPDLTDWSVSSILEKLERAYKNETSGRTAPPNRFTELEQELFDMVKLICDWRLGREVDDSTLPANVVKPLDPEEIIACLKRLQRSVKLWTKQGGRQGYLNYVSSFIL
jgi:hypothetical protein